MSRSPLSEAAKHRLETLFQKDDQAKATRLLEEECGNNLPLLKDLDAVALDRFRFAALKLSAGNLEKLREAIDLAKTDWRDLLVAADFANDAQAHERWFPEATEGS